MTPIEQTLHEAMVKHQAGHLSEAREAYESILAKEGNHALALHLLGMVHYQQHRLQEALDLFCQSLELDPQNATFHYDLGLLYFDLNQHEKAFQAFQQAVHWDPQFADAWTWVADMAERQQDDALQKTAYERLLQLEPQNAKWHARLAQLLEHMNRPHEALIHWVDASMKEPTSADYHFEVARMLFEQNRLEEAVQMFQHVLQIQPDYPQASLYLNNIMTVLGQPQEAKAILNTFYAQTRLDGLRFASLFTLPVVYASSSEIEQWRSGFEEELKGLSTQSLKIDNPVSEIATTPFYLVYQNHDDKSLMAEISALLSQSISIRQLAHPPAKRSRPKIAFVSRHLHAKHTIGRMFRGLIRQLNRERFEIVVCPIGRGANDNTFEPIDPELETMPLDAGDYWGSCIRMHQEAFDMIFYSDIGMESMTYYMALHRLAPVQCVGWGHPVTTGMPNIDYYVSSRWLERDPVQSQLHYTEKLAALDEIPMSLPFPQIQGTPPTRSEFGFDDDMPLLVCPQTLYKFHPDFDAYLAEILRQVPQARLIVFAGERDVWNKQLFARWDKTMPDVQDRVVMLPQYPREQFIRMLSVMNVMLDIPSFNGGNTTLDALAVGTPIITQEGPRLCNRLTGGMLRRIGVTETIVDTMEAYVTQAVSLLTQPERQTEVRNAILANHHPLYDNPQAPRVLEAFLDQVLSGLIEDLDPLKNSITQ